VLKRKVKNRKQPVATQVLFKVIKVEQLAGIPLAEILFSGVNILSALYLVRARRLPHRVYLHIGMLPGDTASKRKVIA